MGGSVCSSCIIVLCLLCSSFLFVCRFPFFSPRFSFFGVFSASFLPSISFAISLSFFFETTSLFFFEIMSLFFFRIVLPLFETTPSPPFRIALSPFLETTTPSPLFEIAPSLPFGTRFTTVAHSDRGTKRFEFVLGFTLNEDREESEEKGVRIWEREDRESIALFGVTAWDLEDFRTTTTGF